MSGLVWYLEDAQIYTCVFMSIISSIMSGGLSAKVYMVVYRRDTFLSKAFFALNDKSQEVKPSCSILLWSWKERDRLDRIVM